MKDVEPQKLIETIHKVLDGEKSFIPMLNVSSIL